ncbi:MAG: hypothetical protein HY795_05625 [Desulfovibrio sp.]|nr:hypothetical protein [Desulfovibrio sp.]MBI4960560.1 hypothetical protein [Desulfovibrio sp.]
MERPLSKRIADILTLDVIELIGDEACEAVNKMQNDNDSEEKIVSFIEKKLSEVSGKIETDRYHELLDTIRKSNKYQADFMMLKKNLRRGLPVRIARNQCFELIGLHGYSMMEDKIVSENLMKGKDVRMIAKALAVKDYLIKYYNVDIPILWLK